MSFNSYSSSSIVSALFNDRLPKISYIFFILLLLPSIKLSPSTLNSMSLLESLSLGIGSFKFYGNCFAWTKSFDGFILFMCLLNDA